MGVLKERLAALDARMAEPSFWDDSRAAQGVIAEANQLRARLDGFQKVEQRVADLAVLHEMAVSDNSLAAQHEVLAEYAATQQFVDETEARLLLREPHDMCNAILSFNAGAGGTEACDWTSMLIRMFERWAQRHGCTWTMMDALPGEEAGVRNATAIVKGENAYGFLKSERGVHRLVRISPFNAQGKRQTSFASVDVAPEIEDEIEVKVEEKDLRIDVYRSSGCGGQGVNTTDSAVRITHLPTGLVVTCQNERSQIKNKASAMKILKARLYQIELDKRRAEVDKSYAQKGEIGWGHQIRSYVLQPYQMVKDLRTGEATSDTQAVLDGNLDRFMYAFLKGKKRSDQDTDEEV